MRRWIWYFLLALVVGALTSVLAAWLCSITDRSREFDAMWLGRVRAEAFAQEQREQSDRPAATGGRWYQTGYRGVGSDVLLIHEWRDGQAWQVIEHRCGWPIPCVVGREMFSAKRPPAGPAEFKGAVRTDVMIDLYYPTMGGAATRCRALLPLWPMWPEFIWNTLLHAAAVLAAIGTWILVKRTVRRLRGRCPACGYPIGASPRCSECGAPVKCPRIRKPGQSPAPG